MGERELYEGPCRGGPMDRNWGASRFPKGFLLVDKSNGHAWVYEWSAEDGVFLVRNDEPAPLLLEGRLKAAREPNYDVRAL